MKIESLLNQHSNCQVTLGCFLHSKSGSAWHSGTGTPALPSLAKDWLKLGSLGKVVFQVRTLKIIPWNNSLFGMWISILLAKLGRRGKKEDTSPPHLNLAFVTIKICFLSYGSAVFGVASGHRQISFHGCCCYCIAYRAKVCDKPVTSKSLSAIFNNICLLCVLASCSGHSCNILNPPPAIRLRIPKGSGDA